MPSRGRIVLVFPRVPDSNLAGAFAKDRDSVPVLLSCPFFANIPQGHPGARPFWQIVGAGKAVLGGPADLARSFLGQDITKGWKGHTCARARVCTKGWGVQYKTQGGARSKFWGIIPYALSMRLLSNATPGLLNK